MPRPVRGVLAVEGVQTGDGRIIAEGALYWPEPPLPIAWLRDGDQHVGLVEVAPQVGVIQTIERVGNEIWFTGIIDDGQEDGAEMVRRMEAGTASLGERFGLSIDGDDFEIDLVATNVGDDDEVVLVASVAGDRWPLRAAAGDGDPEDTEPDAEVIMEAGVDDLVERATRLRIRGVVALAVGAFAEAFMELADGTTQEGDEQGAGMVQDDGVAASGSGHEPGSARPVTAAAAAGDTHLPPADWFADPALDAPTHLTVTPDGRVYGHLAAWGTCHIGRNDICLEPPSSAAGYAHFLTSTSRVGDPAGERVIPTGRLTAQLDPSRDGHADINLDARAAAAHYDSACTAWAEVAAGEDAHGIWVAGAVLPDIDELTLRRVSGLSLSGDWRRLGGSLELVAALSVPTPGFPIRASAASAAPRVRMTGGECTALVAAGVIRPVTDTDRLREELAELRAEVAELRLVTDPLRPLAVERITL